MLLLPVARVLMIAGTPQMKKYFTFEVQILDDQDIRRRFRASNYQVSLTSATVGVRQHSSLGAVFSPSTRTGASSFLCARTQRAWAYLCRVASLQALL